MADRRRLGLTTRASCLLAAGITALLCGIVLGETDLVRAGVLAAAIPLVAAAVVHRSRLQVANRRGLEPRQTSAGDTVTVNLTITNRSVLPTGALLLEDQLPGSVSGRARFVVDSLSGHEARTVSYRIPALGRGRYRVGPLRIRVGDPFRMIELTRSFAATTDFLVLPRVDRLSATDPPRSDDLGGSAGSHSIGSHGADDASTREYRMGDDLRKIHWRSSARTGTLMVRQAERPWRAHTTLLLDLRAGAHRTGPGADPAGPAGADERAANSLEWAVSAAASIATQALRGGRDVGLIADTPPATRIGLASVDHVMTHLATVGPADSARLDPIADQIRVAARDSALVAVLGHLDPLDLRLLSDAPPRGRGTPALALLLDVDSWADPAGPRDSGVDTAAAVLRTAGWRVQVVRRGTDVPRAWQLLLAALPATPGAASLPATAGVAAGRR